MRHEVQATVPPAQRMRLEWALWRGWNSPRPFSRETQVEILLLEYIPAKSRKGKLPCRRKPGSRSFHNQIRKAKQQFSEPSVLARPSCTIQALEVQSYLQMVWRCPFHCICQRALDVGIFTEG